MSQCGWGGGSWRGELPGTADTVRLHVIMENDVVVADPQGVVGALPLLFTLFWTTSSALPSRWWSARGRGRAADWWVWRVARYG